MLPAEAAWAIVFNRQLPQLRSLDLNAAHTPPLTTADLQHIASRCPGLETLRVLGILAGDADLTALQQFPQLTRLSINNIGDSDAAALAGNLTGLRELAIAAPSSLTQGVLHHLADLKQLTHLWVQPNQVPEVEEQEEDADYDQRRAAVRWLFRNEVGEGRRVGTPAGSRVALCQKLATLSPQVQPATHGSAHFTGPSRQRTCCDQQTAASGAPRCENKSQCAASQEAVCYRCPLPPYLQAPEGSPPDVWKQIYETAHPPPAPAVHQHWDFLHQLLHHL